MPKCGYGFIQHCIINYLWYKQTEGPNTIVYGIKLKCEEPFQVKDMNEPKVVQMTKVLYEWFSVMCSEGNQLLSLR
jgi:hypothetical protein